MIRKGIYMDKDKMLVNEAISAMKNAYCVYSNFHVGAALLTKEGKIYKGANVENTSYGATVCAERTAIFSAVANGERNFEAIAITGSTDDLVYPCGICRQVMAEFGIKKIIVSNQKGDYAVTDLNYLLPHGNFLE